MPNVTLFLLRHQAEIKYSDLTADRLLITFYPFVSQRRTCQLMADMVTMLQPKRAVMQAPDQIRLEW